MKRHKGADLLVTAWGKLQGDRPRRLTLHGSDEAEAAYGRHLRRMLSKVEFASWPGQFGRDELWDVLSDTDALVVPSRWVENSPNTILEAQAVGVPIVGSNLGGVAELVEHDHNGLLFEVDDADDLAWQLQRLLDEPDLLVRLRANAMPFKSLDQAIDEIVGVYQQVRRKDGMIRTASRERRSLLWTAAS